jgi:molecular chaperone GrpE (heat shock protein)
VGNWLKGLFKKEKSTGMLQQLERETESLRAMLEDQDKIIANLTGELKKHRDEAEFRLKRSTQAVMEKIAGDLASPVAKLNSQAYVVEEQNHPLNVRDVIEVGKQFIQVFQKYGLRLEGYVGEMTPFDPDHHMPLRQEMAFTLGEPVVIRFVGIGYRGKLLRKASVESSRSHRLPAREQVAASSQTQIRP